MFLATTANQTFWKKEEKILFLGEWCKPFDQHQTLENLDYEVLPYHWDDRGKLYNDQKYLSKLYERVLGELADDLNKLHKVEFSIRYWRLVIGPWLYYFLQILYDRYLSVSSAIDSGKVTSTWLPNVLMDNVVPKDFKCFSNWFARDDYNLFLYGQIIEKIGGLDYEKKNEPLIFKDTKEKKNISVRSSLMKFAEILSEIVPDCFNKVVFIACYIKPKDLFRLQLSLGQLPYFCISGVGVKSSDVNNLMREQIKIAPGINRFESMLSGMIRQQIPKVYIEEYLNTAKIAQKKYPKKNKVIVTSNALFGNEGFKLWAGESMERGSKLVGTQHGGAHGIALWSTNETHEVKVADRYFTWGWKDQDVKTTVPLASARLSWGGDKIKPDPLGDILWTGFSIPRYSYCLYSSPVGPQYLDYIDDQKLFLKEVCPAVHKLLLLRLYPTERGWGEVHMWKKIASSLRIYRGQKSSFDQLNESRLSVGTYNGMGILETLSANYPTIIYWNPNHWELRASAKPIFDALLDAGIFHETPQSAAFKVNEVYQDTQPWWTSDKTQKARRMFCDHFANTSRPLVRYKEELLRLM